MINSHVEGATVAVTPCGNLTLQESILVKSNTAVVASGSNIIIEHVLIDDVSVGIDARNANGQIRACQIRGRTSSSGTGLRIRGGMSVAAADSLNPEPTQVSRFHTGVLMENTGSVSNVVSRDNRRGFETSSGLHVINYCTAVNNTEYGFRVFDSLVLNCIAASNSQKGIEASQNTSRVDFVDSWNNTVNYNMINGASKGPNTESFDPFFVDPGARNYRLMANSIFKNYSNSGGEIGAYGPGPGPTTAVPQRQVTSWGRIKAAWREAELEP